MAIATLFYEKGHSKIWDRVAPDQPACPPRAELGDTLLDIFET